MPMSAVDRISVLLVEDDEGDAILVEALLEEVGADVELLRARTLREAMTQLSGADCVLLDLGLPDTTGLDGLLNLLAQSAPAAIIVLTGLNDEHQGMRAVAAGAEDYLVKGQVDGAALLRGIRYAVGRKQAEETQRQLRDEKLHAAEKTRLERGLLPSPLLRGPAPLVKERYRPGGSRMLLGGDFYDTVQAHDGTLHVIIGDVCGHGPDEAALGVLLRIAWRALLLAEQTPERVLHTMHELLELERHQPGLFTTACMISVAPDRRSARVFLAGHPEPILMADDKIVELPRTRAGLPLGVLPDSEWDALDVELPPGWSLMIYTDGLVEGRVGNDSERLGSERLIELIGQVRAGARGGTIDPDELLDSLISRVKELNGGELDDDMAVLLISEQS
ncbi:response regulator receiver modulated serine phosphatase [Actinosynnema pretiosum subsp. pretiosum]|nr:response regulator receiver modulated serine phosphatase [Actinosynnema pretiosum subsp. pretiosum]